MKAFRVIGEIEVSKRRWQKFSKEISADDEKSARSKILADLGSRHKRKQRSVRIDSVQELQTGDITNPVLRYQLGVE
ncbi:MAG TPA: 50S ribosomal protein LX [Euryarchaeota archaeon]|nr:50S ribosomal protein LX [Euryarchaeota archaeon]